MPFSLNLKSTRASGLLCQPRMYHGIHAAYPVIYAHDFCNAFGQVFYTATVQVYAMGVFIFIAAFAETAQGFVRKGLFLKTCCVEGVLQMQIKHKIFGYFVVRIVKQFTKQRLSSILVLYTYCPPHCYSFR